MDCKYDLEGELLYDVKWYKDDMQFFRCLANGSVHEFPLDGVSKTFTTPSNPLNPLIQITLDYSPRASVGSCHFTLTGLTGSSGGRYKCEVSLDAPTFRTVAQTVDFRVSQPSKRVQDRNNDVSTDDEPMKSEILKFVGQRIQAWFFQVLQNPSNASVVALKMQVRFRNALLHTGCPRKVRKNASTNSRSIKMTI